MKIIVVLKVQSTKKVRDQNYNQIVMIGPVKHMYAIINIFIFLGECIMIFFTINNPKNTKNG